MTRALLTALVWLALVPAGAVAATSDPEPPATPPPSTFNPFLPDDQSLSDCLGMLPKPNCGSEARGGWAQYAVFGSLMTGLGFIAWRIVRSARRRSGTSAGGDGDPPRIDEGTDDAPSAPVRSPDG